MESPMSDNQPSLPRDLFEKNLTAIVQRLSLEEVTGEDGGPYLPLASQLPMVQGEVGNVRLFTGGPLFRMVTCSLVAAPMQLDSHMLFAFTPGSSAVPHFTLDSVSAGDHHAFHLDLIPRMDLAAHRPYLEEVYQPLTEAYETGSAVEGLSRAHLSPTQLAIMSPWMLAHRATAEAFQDIGATVAKYLEHWFTLLDKGVSDAALEGMSAADLQARNLANKAMIFCPEIDPVWQRITGLIGPEAVAAQRALLLGADE